MSKYISILSSQANNTYWKAIQVAETLDAIRANKYYNSGVSTSLDKNDEDTFVENKTVIEINTQAPSDAQIIKLSQPSKQALLAHFSKEPKAAMKRLKS